MELSPGAPSISSIIEIGEEEANDLATILKALAEPVRIKVINALAGAAPEPLCVKDVTNSVGAAQPTTSHHLRILYAGGLVGRAHQGSSTFHTLSTSRLEELAAVFTELANAATAKSRSRSRH